MKILLPLALTGCVLTTAEAAVVVSSLASNLVCYYDFEHPVPARPDWEADQGRSHTDIQLVNGGAAMRVADGAHPGSVHSLQTKQVNPDAAGNDDWKAGIYGAGSVSTLSNFNAVAGITLMGWVKPTGPNPSLNTTTDAPDDYYNAVGLFGVLSGNSDGHNVRALLEIIRVNSAYKLVVLGRRVDDGRNLTLAAADDWQELVPSNTWTHLAATFDFDTGVMALYRNGTRVAAGNTTTDDAWNITPGTDLASASNPTGIKIGGSFPQNSAEKNPFNGRLDDLMFFDRVLSPDEVRQQYASFFSVTHGELATNKLADIRMRDACILPDEATQTYYIVASARGAAVRAYTSKDLVNWVGPHIVYQTSKEMWGEDVEIRAIWAPEIHFYKGKYYLFVTFDSTAPFAEQWRNWLPRVRRASQVLVSDTPLGPYKPFTNEPTLPADMMTLDGTLWEEDGVPYMVFCHEWVQIVNGTVEMVRLKPDLSATVGEPKRLFWGSDAPWARVSPEHGCWVTDGPWLLRSKSGKLFLPWSSFSKTGYTVGVAVSDSGKLAGPWKQRAEPLFKDDGGHSMFFRRFDGQLMMALHSPNGGGRERIHLFEIEDTGETLKVIRQFDGREAGEPGP